MLKLLKELLLGNEKTSVTDIDFTNKTITEIDQISYETLSKF